MADLPDWVALPQQENPALKAYFDVLKPGVTTKEKVQLGTKAALIFGRNPDTTDVLLEHPSISRRHAAVLHDVKGGLFLYDFGSTHGTFLDGKKAAARQPLPLQQGSRIKFAESSRTYVLQIPSSSSVTNGNKKRQEEAEEMVLDKEALASLPLSFGGGVRNKHSSSSNNGAGALSKDAMAAGIAEMMKQIEATEKRREEDDKKKETEAATNGEKDEEEESEEEDDDGFGPTRPPAGTKSGAGEHPSSSSSSTAAKKKPMMPPPRREPEDDDDNDGEEEEDSSSPEVIAKKYQVPMSHEANLRGHHKSITCLAMDPAGSRVAVGGMDYKLLLYDFGGMDRSHRPFRELEPDDGKPVIAVSWSTSGDRFLCATGSAQPKVFDRDGLPLLVFVKGDPYIADMVHTKGHTMAVTAAQWHPMERDTVMTASLDGTVRLWDLNAKLTFDDKLPNKRVIKARSQRNTTVPVTCAMLSPSADYVAAGAQDGSVQLFSLRKSSWIKPDILMRPAHGPDNQVTAVAWTPDGKTLASRGYDNTVKLWDIRKPQTPIKVLQDVATFYDSANIAFSPDGKLLCCGTNVMRGDGTGTLKFFEVASPATEPLLTMGVAPEASVTNIIWHRRLKQIACGTSVGGTKVLYDPTFSVKGALQSSNRVKRASDPFDAGSSHGVVGKILNPSALPMYRDEEALGKRKRKDRADPIKSKKPEMPMNGPGLQGRVSGLTNFTQYVMQNKTKNTILEEDPREAILKYSEKAKEGTQLVGRAYAKTAPVTPFLAKTLEQEVEDLEKFQEEILKK